MLNGCRASSSSPVDETILELEGASNDITMQEDTTQFNFEDVDTPLLTFENDDPSTTLAPLTFFQL